MASDGSTASTRALHAVVLLVCVLSGTAVWSAEPFFQAAAVATAALLLLPERPPVLAWSAYAALLAGASIGLLGAPLPAAASLGVGTGALVLLLAAAARLAESLLPEPRLAIPCVAVVAGLLAMAPVWLGPAAEALDWPAAALDVLVAVSPLSTLAALAEVDYLRGAWFYAHTPVGSLRYGYAGPWTMSLGYALCGALCLAVDRVVLRSRAAQPGEEGRPRGDA